MKSTCGAFGLILGLAVGSIGVPVGSAHAAEDDPAYISLGVGYYDVWQRDDEAADFRLEYRHDQGIWVVKPWLGVEVTTDGAVYGVGGLLFDFVIADRLAVTPSFGVGAYHDGDGRDLGHVVEFRSQIEVGYRFENRSRLGVAVGHISNASIGDDNPGTEILTVYYHLPLTTLFGE